MEGTRLRILHLLQRNVTATVDSLARSIGLAPATIRRHLDILQRDRLVAFEEVRKKTGRPEYSFYLTERGQESLPKNYDLLLNMLIKEIADLSTEDIGRRDGEQVLEMVFQRLSANVWSDHEDQVRGEDLPSRLAALVRLLDERDFFPETEVSEGVLQIRLLNCPFRAVALNNNAVCTFDSNLMSAMLDIDLERRTCIHDGDGGCVYAAPVDDREAQLLSAVAEA